MMLIWLYCSYELLSLMNLICYSTLAVTVCIENMRFSMLVSTNAGLILLNVQSMESTYSSVLFLFGVMSIIDSVSSSSVFDKSFEIINEMKIRQVVGKNNENNIQGMWL